MTAFICLRLSENPLTALALGSVSTRLVIIRHLEKAQKLPYIRGMEIFAMIFALAMLAMAVGMVALVATVDMSVALIMVFILLLTVWIFWDRSPPRKFRREELNAFQASLAEDD